MTILSIFFFLNNIQLLIDVKVKLLKIDETEIITTYKYLFNICVSALLTVYINQENNQEY